MAKKTVADIDVKGKKVLMRVDFNVPLDGETITDDRRIAQALPTIKSVLDRGGRLILMSHLGRPKGGPEAKYSLKPVQLKLSELLGKPVGFVDDCIGPKAEAAANSLQDGDVIVLENLRFHKEEEKNDANFAQQLAKLGDVYINDAFGTAHREHASTFGVPQAMQGKPRAIGFLIQKELKFLGEAVSNPQRPFVAIMGGAKVSDKIAVIENLLAKADSLLIGGAMAYTFFLAQGKEVGKSLVEKDKVDLAKDLLAKFGDKLKLPVDTVISDQMTDDATTKVVEGNIPADMEGFDIGPKTCEIYKTEIMNAKTIIWNGPMGVFEKEAIRRRHDFRRRGGRRQRLRRTARRRSSAVATAPPQSSSSGLPIKVSHVSTGGGASLEFLENGHFSTLDILD